MGGRCVSLKAVAVAAFVASAMFSCADQRVAGGNSSGTSNTVAGRLVDGSGNGARGVCVVARPLRWGPEDPREGNGEMHRAVTDSAGNFALHDLPPDVWVLEAADGKEGHLFAPVVSGAGDADVDVGTGALGVSAPLVGRLRMANAEVLVGGVVGISGTAHVAAIDGSGRFRFESVPPGTVRLVAQARSLDERVRAEATTTIDADRPRDSLLLDATSEGGEDYSTWEGSKMCLIDLSSPSSYLGSDQYEVPILVDLDGSILPRWDLDGSSIRFSSENGRHLPFEIETWNPVLRRARVWVRIDTLNKASAKHHFKLHWGKEGVPGRSDGGAVFDSSRGWLGAWHFGEKAAWSNATGRAPTFTRPAGSGNPFFAGGVLHLESSTRLELADPALATTGGVMAMAFVRVDSVVVDRAFLVRQGAVDSTTFDWALSLYDSSGTLNASFSTRLQPWSPAPPKTTGSIPRSTWTLVGGVFDTSAHRSRLELADGINRWTTPYDSLHRRHPSPKLVVGGGMVGRIDEIRLMDRPMHPDFVRAQWLSWDPASKMLRWLP